MAVEQGNIAQMQISRTTNVKNLAASIAKHIQRGKIVRMVAIGAGAIRLRRVPSSISLRSAWRFGGRFSSLTGPFPKTRSGRKSRKSTSEIPGALSFWNLTWFSQAD